MPRVQKVTPKALRNPLFGALRSMPGVPKASLESTLSKPPFEPPLSDLASESDTCPEYPYIGPSRKLPSVPRVQRVILPPEASECDTCPEYRSRESSSGCRPSRHVSRVPKPRDPSRVLSECAACPESPHREITRALGEHATCPRECFLFRRI